MRTKRTLPKQIQRVVTVAKPFTTVKRATFAPGQAYLAIGHEGSPLWELTHPDSGERACFSGREITALAQASA